jgi:hypothetical protein
MNLAKRFTTLASCLLLLGALKAQDAGSETVTVEGVGKTEASAKKAAFREALQKVVGVLIDANTQVKNEEIIKDEVLEYSGGFISKSEILSSKKDDEGLVRVKVKCVVEKTQVKKKLEDLKVLVVKLDGAGFAEKEMSKDELRKNAAKLINKAIEERKKIYSISAPDELNKLQIEPNGYILIPVSITFDQQRFETWINNWIPVFDKLSVKKMTGFSTFKKSIPGDGTSLRNKYNDEKSNKIRFEAKNNPLDVNNRRTFFLTIADSFNTTNGSARWLGYKFDSDLTLIKNVNVSIRGIRNPEASSHANLTLELLDKNGNHICGSQTTHFGSLGKNTKPFIYDPEKVNFNGTYLTSEGGGDGFKLKLIEYPPSPHFGRLDLIELSPIPGGGIPGDYGCIFKLKIPKEDYAKITKIVAKLEWNDVETKE